uniref:PD-(D/E)XK nuclease domain-containing protein n=1 Tax=Candidatus Kentrum sp. SD TaxID=2126332 RepID=A0A450YGW0_9GAMM|nr:MAG: hypothetical protein BECKSD772F_GA0070984_10712 [Candidatus Kentron sp. SD]VFK46425.1 MAG: hypothetical protein BECKSD772E_GA0070983_10732 [Candidatus Kentron sp. SD]VFK79398.1 MAG: hypothetical protein BECKSD772D_GA0070982_10482 [Candidatus Kentron sp. SD]
MKGNEYADLIAKYIVANYKSHGITVYREVEIGKSIIGKNRRVDIFVVCEATNNAFAIECKYQETTGTVDEKIPYALSDIAALRIDGCICYAGEGFSEGVSHLLQASEFAAYCLPDATNLAPSKKTRELDHMLAMNFRWWDTLVGERAPFTNGSIPIFEPRVPRAAKEIIGSG